MNSDMIFGVIFMMLSDSKMNCLCLLIIPCELILVLLVVNLHNMIYVDLLCLLGLAKCIPYALRHPRILGVSV